MAAMTRADAIADATREDAIVTSRKMGPRNSTVNSRGSESFLTGLLISRFGSPELESESMRMWDSVFLFDVVPLIWRTVA